MARVLRTHRISTAFLATLAIWATIQFSAQAEAKSQVAVNVYIDRAQNEDFIASQEVASFVYDYVDARIQLADEDIMGVWKGDSPIQRYVSGAFMGLFEDQAQFAPVLLVVEIVNQGGRDMQIVGSYLEVAESSTDREPYMELISDYNPDCDENLGLKPDFEFVNYGWGPVENAKITYSFGTEDGASGDRFTIDAGTFDEKGKVSVLQGLEASGLDLNRIAGGVFPCPSMDEVSGCTQALAGSGVLGALANAVFPSGKTLYSRVWGRIDYSWSDNYGASNPRSSPFFVDIPILEFQTEGGPECGAPGPVERGYELVKLSLDQTDYRIPLAYAGKLAPHQDRRFALRLAADKSSQHSFRVVLELADGNTASSPEIILLYFLPRLGYTN